MAIEYDIETKFILGSILDMSFSDDIYDAIYCYNTLHLFLRTERFHFLQKCYNQLKANGFVFFVAFSEKENSFGKGKKIEINAFLIIISINLIFHN